MGYGSYGHSNALPEVLAHLHACRGTWLDPTRSYTIKPGGDTWINPSHIGPWRAPQEDASPRRGAVGAHLPLGLRPVRRDSERVGPVAFPPHGRQDGDGPDAMAHEATAPMPPGRYELRRGEPGEPTDAFVDRIISAVALHDNGVCAKGLARLPVHRREFVRGRTSTIVDLCAFVDKVVYPDMPEVMRPDTMFIGMGVLREMGEDWMVYTTAQRGHAVWLDHMHILAREDIPDDVAYVTSEQHGPVFVDGLTVLTCTDIAFVVKRYSAVVVPGGGDRPACGFGVRIRSE